MSERSFSTKARAVVLAATITLSLTCAAIGGVTDPAISADLGGDCCADLEERIAELEATTARKGNRKVSLTVAGQVNKMLMFWDDGYEGNAYVVGNKDDQTNISFTGDAKISPGWSVGYDMTLRLRDNLSDAVDQDNDNDLEGTTFQLWQNNWWIESESYGKVSLGKASRVSDTAPESDLSETGVAAYAGVQDVGGAFLVRRSDGTLLNLARGDVYNHFNGDTANLVRYDTSAFGGFIASASWGEDDIWDVGLKYQGEGGGFQLAASLAYTEVRDTDGEFADIDQSTLVGSAAVLHQVSGLNALVSFGVRKFDGQAIDADGALRTPRDTKFIYAKIGWIAKLNILGPTAFYGEYGHFEDFVSVVDDAALVTSLGPGAVRITGNKADVWGAGVVQHVESAEMQFYVGYRRHGTHFDLVGPGGDSVGILGLGEFHTLAAGSKIAF